MVKNEDLLPIGTIVLLKGGKKRVMIIGIKQISSGEDEQHHEYDYAGGLYPEGNISNDKQILFDQEDLDCIFFRGCDDEDRKDFINALTILDDKIGKRNPGPVEDTEQPDD